MIDRQHLLADLQLVLRKLEADLLDRTDSDEVPEVGKWLRAEYQKAKDAERTAHTQKQWMDDFITQVAAAWVLSCVFARFLEDNELVDPPRIAGPGKRLDRARDEHTLFFQDAERAKLTDREYLLDIFEGLANLPAGKDVFGPHNPMNALPNWLGPDAAGGLLRFFQKIDSDSGDQVHDFTDPDWDTRFLGDLYQDLSEAARKKYALLQTPDFVEEFILDRTLEPALDEFGLTPESDPDRRFRMIDPACGSGHFLLGAFLRIFDRWQKQEPGTNVRKLVQRTLDSIHGVDINPFAIAIAQFRLLLAALQASDVRRLVDAPAFHMNLACGDSLYHGVERQQTLGEWTDESHYFRTEDAENLRRILREGTFHAVVANPPYITPKDRAANEAYRRLYPKSCHMKYSLSVPFMERIFNLAINGRSSAQHVSGITGQITANSFMKREFGKKLIEEFFLTVDVTHVIDTSGAYIPGHSTPTVILLGKNQLPVNSIVRAVLGISGEPQTPDNPADGIVWTAIKQLTENITGKSPFVSVTDSPRERFLHHPWSIGGGGASELKVELDDAGKTKLGSLCDSIGYFSFPGLDDAFVMPAAALKRHGVPPNYIRSFVTGDRVRDWAATPNISAFAPYDAKHELVDFVSLDAAARISWTCRTSLQNVLSFGGKTRKELGDDWWGWYRWIPEKYRRKSTIVFAQIASHNHFCFQRNNHAFNVTSPAIQLKTDELSEYEELQAILNSSVACFWQKQVTQPKTQVTGMDSDAWRIRRQMDGTKLKAFPLPATLATRTGRRLADRGKKVQPHQIGSEAFKLTENCLTSLRDSLCKTQECRDDNRRQMIRLQEDLDWECYRLYGLLEEDLTYPGESLGIQLGERAFEIVLARKMARGEVQTTWFAQHGSTPITELPDHWPDDYKRLVERRIEVIESNPQIALIEQPEYKRRWNTEPWNSQVERALKSWLLDRLESFFDIDGRMNDEGNVTAKIDISLTSVAKLADIARQDKQFMEVAEVYRDDPSFDVQRLVEELVQSEHVPQLPILRYKPNGLRNRAEWEKTWELQRLEDKLHADDAVKFDDYELTAKQREGIVEWQRDTSAAQRADDRGLDAIMSIPVPPKYKSADFISSGGARYWSLRGKLDVPKERWVSFPHCEGPDGTLMIAWAGYNHLQLAQAISAYYVDVQERLGGRDDPRLIPLLAGVIELLPWLRQWHHEIDPEYNQRMDEVYEGFVTEEAKGLGLTIDEIKAWQSPKKSPKKRKASNK